jgi:hypothetical protein
MTRSIDQAYVELAREHNDVALMSIAALEPYAARPAGRDAVRFARRGIEHAKTVDARRCAIVELAVGNVLTSGELGPGDALVLFLNTNPTAEAVFDAFMTLSDRVQRFDDLRCTGSEDIPRLRRLMETFADAAVDAALGDRGVEDGLAERHQTALRAFQRYAFGLDCTMGSREIWHKCRAAGLDRASTNVALQELAAAGILEQRPGSGGFGPRYIPTLEGRQVIPRLRLQAPTPQVAQLAS